MPYYIFTICDIGNNDLVYII